MSFTTRERTKAYWLLVSQEICALSYVLVRITLNPTKGLNVCVVPLDSTKAKRLPL